MVYKFISFLCACEGNGNTKVYSFYICDRIRCCLLLERSEKIYRKPCLHYIKEAALDTSAYWFGTNYSLLCPKGSATSFNCTNTREGTADSLASRMQLDLTQLDRTVNITYTHGEGKKVNKCMCSLLCT